jgi:hypothetical protein
VLRIVIIKCSNYNFALDECRLGLAAFQCLNCTQNEHELDNVKNKDIILQYLKSKQKSIEDDPDQKWITTWNDYLGIVIQKMSRHRLIASHNFAILNNTRKEFLSSESV